MKTNWHVRHIATLALVSASASALAQGLAKEGRYEFTACWSGTSNLIAFSNAHSAFSYEMTGSSRSAVPGGFGDKNTFRCVGMNASFAGKVTLTATCEATDADGDKRLTYFLFSPDGKVQRETVAGTGKYDGMATFDSTVKGLGPFPPIKAGTFQDCNHQTGGYRLK